MTPVLLDCGHKDIFWHNVSKGDKIHCVACQETRTVKDILEKDREVSS